MLNISKNKNSKTFIADADGIKKLKTKFVLSRPQFLYLRKGEDIGADIIAMIYGIALNIDWNTVFAGISTACNVYTILELRKQKRFQQKYLKEIQSNKEYKIRDFRITCTKNKVTLAAEKINRKLGVKVKFASKRKSYKHRFYLTDKAYAFFVRVGEGEKAKFYGHIGTDGHMIDVLKNQFLKEWNEN